MENGVKNILDLEKQVESTIKKSQTKAEKIISDANSEGIKLRSELEENTNKKRENAIKKAEGEIKKKCGEITVKSAADKDKLVKKAENNMDKAVDYIISALKKK